LFRLRQLFLVDLIIPDFVVRVLFLSSVFATTCAATYTEVAEADDIDASRQVKRRY